MFFKRWGSALRAIGIGLLIGGLSGLAVYLGNHLSGAVLYVLVGTTGGAVAAAVINAYAPSVRLTEITISVPQFGDARFAVTRDNKLVAWRLFVESVTRISLQPLDEDTGIIREAMNSLYNLFGTTRSVLADAEPSRQVEDVPTVERLAIAMLNKELRPFLSTWHPRLKRWENANPGASELDWPENRVCRTELAQMQQRLAIYVAGFGELGGVVKPLEIMEGADRIGASDPAR